MWLWERVVKNWETSSVAIIAMVAIVAGWGGLEVSGTQLSTVIVGLQGLVLLFAKD